MKKWKFKPASIRGQKVSAVVAARVVFYLRRPGKSNGKPFVEAGVSGDPYEPGFRDVMDGAAPGVTPPKVIRQVRPQYTSEAMRQMVQGQVEIEVVVGVDGTVTAARVFKSLDRDFGLDRQAVLAARQWRFTPALRNGESIPVKVILILEFRLH